MKRNIKSVEGGVPHHFKLSYYELPKQKPAPLPPRTRSQEIRFHWLVAREYFDGVRDALGNKNLKLARGNAGQALRPLGRLVRAAVVGVPSKS